MSPETTPKRRYVKRPPGRIFGLRVDVDERLRWHQAAKKRGLALAAFIRKLARDECDRVEALQTGQEARRDQG